MQPNPYAQQFPMAPFGGIPKMAPPLYIGDLDETIQEEYLFDHFSRYGQLHSVRIMKDANTGQSRGYAFVNFTNARDAESARQYEQYALLGQKRIRIMFKRPINEIPKDANVYVKNLDPAVDVKELHDHFNSVGTVISAKVAENRGKSLGYGYVQFETAEDAKKALELNGTKLKESNIEVEIFVPRDKRAIETEQERKNLYIKNLPKDNTEGYLLNLFSQFGEIASHAIKPDPKGVPAAFVSYKDAISAQRAVDSLNKSPIMVDNEPIYVNFLQPKTTRVQGFKNDTNLYLKNLKSTVTEKELYNAFINFGRIISTAVKENVVNEKKVKCGFVNFESTEDAKNAQFNGPQAPVIKALFESENLIYINPHQNRAVRSKFLANQKRGFSALNPYAMTKNMYSQPYFGPYQMMQMQMMYGGQRPFVRENNGFGGGFRPNNRPQYQNNRGGRFQGGQRQGGYQQGGYQQGGYNQERNQERQERQERNQGGNQGYNQGNRQYNQGGNQGGQQRQYNNQGGQQRQQSNYNGGFTQNKMPQQGQQTQQVTTRPQQVQQQVPQQSVQQQRVAPTQQVSAAKIVSVNDLKGKLDEFLKLDQSQQMRILGELLYPNIRKLTNDDFAPKVTGMLIDLTVLEVSDILEMLENPQALQERVDEAVELLQSA